MSPFGGRVGMLFWDFDYTLGFRGVEANDEARHPWGYCLLEILDREEPGHIATLESVRAQFHKGFPWHRHHESHPHLSDGDAWWGSLQPMFCSAFEAAGVTKERAAELGARYRACFTDASAWSLYPDTLPVLRRLADDGWRHAIVSNHVPELPELLRALGLDAVVDFVACSAATGYEKPHSEAFRAALAMSGDVRPVWMIGDNPIADVQGAEAIGIPAIQVRTRRGEGVTRHSPDLEGVIEIVSADTRR